MLTLQVYWSQRKTYNLPLNLIDEGQVQESTSHMSQEKKLLIVNTEMCLMWVCITVLRIEYVVS